MKIQLGMMVKVIRKGHSAASSKYFGRIGKITKIGKGYICLNIEEHTGGLYLDEVERYFPNTRNKIEDIIEEIIHLNT